MINNIKTDPLNIELCQIYTIVGEAEYDKKIYANGVMDVEVQLVMTFNRDVSQDEISWFSSKSIPVLGHKRMAEFVPVINDVKNDLHFIDDAGFYTGMIHNRNKNENMFYQLLVEELSMMKSQRADILAKLKNNNYNYYEAYGNRLNPNQISITTTVRAGDRTKSEVMFFKITMPDGTIIFTDDTSAGSAATLQLTCLTPVKVKPRGASGIVTLLDGLQIFNINYYLAQKDDYNPSCRVGLVGINDLIYVNQEAESVHTFAIWSSEYKRMVLEEKYVGNVWLREEEAGLHGHFSAHDSHGAGGGELLTPKEYLRTGLHNTYHWPIRSATGNVYYVKKVFSIWNPFRIFYNNGTVGMYKQHRSEYTAYDTLDSLGFYQYHMIDDLVYKDTHEIDIRPKEKYDVNMYVCLANGYSPDKVAQFKAKDSMAMVATQDQSLNSVVKVPIILMDRYGTRHSLFLKDTLYYSNSENLGVSYGLSIE